MNIAVTGKQEITKVTLNKTEAVIYVNGTDGGNAAEAGNEKLSSTVQLTAAPAATMESGIVYKWSSTNENVAVVDENGKVVDKYINAVPFNSEYYTTNSHGEVTYVEPCSAAYAIFDELQVLSVEITVSVPDGQTYVGISEVRILGK